MTPVDIDKLKELLAKGVSPSDSGWYVSGYTSCGTARISDGLAHGMFPFHCEAPQAELIVAAVNALPSLIAKAERVDALEAALRDIADLRLATERGTLAARADRMWNIAIAQIGDCNALSPKESE